MNEKPKLDYLEFNVTDHCNMKCAACALFSTIAKPGYISTKQLQKDLARLADLFSGIKLIRLIGGEPLLNKQITEIIEITRTFFPKSNIHILTNGSLLFKMKSNFWSCVKSNHIEIDITLYPTLVNLESFFDDLSKKNEVNFNIKKKIFFKKFLRYPSTEYPEYGFNKTFKFCSFKYSTFLRNGMISACHMPSMAYILNDHFGTQIPTNGALNIYENDITAETILTFLKKPSITCQYCSEHTEKFTWKQSQPTLLEWCVSTPTSGNE